jgi:proteasome maturation protein
VIDLQPSTPTEQPTNLFYISPLSNQDSKPRSSCIITSLNRKKRPHFLNTTHNRQYGKLIRPKRHFPSALISLAFSHPRSCANKVQSLRIVPESSHTSSYSHLASASAPSAPGLHDTLRSGVGPSTLDSSAPQSAHPLEARLKNWEATREKLRMEMLRRTYGMAEPIRRGMELKIVRDGQWRPAALGGSKPSLHEEILRGTDEAITWEDVYTGEESAPIVGMQEEMERKLKM